MATFPISMTVSEYAGIARTSEILVNPCSIWLPDDAATPTATTGLGVTDSLGTAVAAQFDVIARWWGDSSDTSKRIKVLLVSFPATVSANSTAVYYLANTGSGSTTDGITITTVASQYQLDTNSAGSTTGIQAAVNRTGGQNVLDYVKLFVSGSWQSIIATGNAGGLLKVGVTTAEDSGTHSNTQSGTYLSSNDTSSYTTSVETTGKLWTRIKIAGVKVKNGGTAFQGKNSENGGVTPDNIDVTHDVYLTFYRDAKYIKCEVFDKSTQSKHDYCDQAVDKYGLRVVPVFSGSSTKIACRDEAAATHVTSGVASSAQTVRQTITVAAPSLGFALSKSGPLSFNASSTTMLEGFFNATASDDKWGIAIAPRYWREKFPMGFSYDQTNLDWEILNPTQSDIEANAARTYHVKRGPHWDHALAFIIFQVGAFDATTTKSTIQRLVGFHEASSQTAGGTQATSLLVQPTTLRTHYQTSKAWVARLRPSTATTAVTGADTATDWTATPITTALGRLDRHLQIWYDNTKADDSLSWRDWQATVCSTDVKWLGWRYFGCVPGAAAPYGTTEYEPCHSLGLAWLSTGTRQYWDLFNEMAMHHVTLDFSHTPNTTDMANDSVAMLVGFQTGPFGWHLSGLSANTQEIQQFTEFVGLAYFLTGHPIYKEMLQTYIKPGLDKLHFGTISGFYHDKSKVGAGTCNISNGSSQVTVNDSSIYSVNSTLWVKYGKRTAGPNTLGSTGTTITSTAHNLDGIGVSTIGTAIGLAIKLTSGAQSGQIRTVTAIVDADHFTIDSAFSVDQAGVTWDMLDVIIASITSIPDATHLNTDRTFNYTATGLTCHTEIDRLSRKTGWPMLAYCCYNKVFHDTDSLTKMGHLMDYLLFSEQQASHPTVISLMGGMGHVAGLATDISALPYMYTEHTYINYPQLPLMRCHEWGTLATTNGYASQISQTQLDNTLGFMDRYCRTVYTGLDGLTRIKTASTEGTNRGIPITRGGDLQSATQYARFVQQYNTQISTLPEGFFTKCNADYLTNIQNLPSQATINAGYTTTPGPVILGVDVLAYVADKKYHATGDTTRRDFYLNLAAAILVDMGLTFDHGASIYSDPTDNTYADYTGSGPSTGLGYIYMQISPSSGNGTGNNRYLKQMMRMGHYVLNTLETGFDGRRFIFGRH